MWYLSVFGFIINLIDCKYLQSSNDPWHCLSCCNNIFPFATQIKTSIHLFPHQTTNSFSLSANGGNDKESLLSLKSPSDLALLYNQFNNTSPAKNSDPENVVNSKFYVMWHLTKKIRLVRPKLKFYQNYWIFTTQELILCKILWSLTWKKFQISKLWHKKVMKSQKISWTWGLGSKKLNLGNLGPGQRMKL